MILWVAILLLTVASVLVALWSFLFGKAQRGAIEHALAFYEARKAELARLEAEGQISGTERAAAEAEQARRLIAIGKSEEKAADSVQATRRRKAAALAVIVMLPAIALVTYRFIGTPTMSDLPLAQRTVDPQVAALRDAIRQIEAHLQQNPNDGRGHEVVAPVYLRLGRFEDAANAFRRALDLLGETPERLSNLGESLVASESGAINTEARAVFERAVKMAPDHAKSRFYLALAIEQDGQPAKAYADLVALANSMPEGGPRGRVVAEIERFREQGKVPPGAPELAGPVAGTSSAAGQAIAAMPEAERQQAIRNMVEGLWARLEQSGGTFEEWYRLIQARLVLGERDKARAHLAVAREKLAGDPATLARIEEVAKAFGLRDAAP